jgi:enoyl-CoA hydratase
MSGPTAVRPVLYQRQGQVAHITLSRPESLNAIDGPMRSGIESAMRRADRDERIRVVIIRGAGDRAFSAGADIREFDVPSSLVAARAQRQQTQFTDVIAGVTKPTIAVIHGYCLGGGLEIALACDIRIASDDAVFGLPEVTIGLIPGAGGTQRLSRLVGVGRALLLCLTGERIDAETALQVGLVTKVVKRDTLDEAAASMAATIAANAPRAVAYAKEAVLKGAAMPLLDGLRLERDLATLLLTTSDRAEGVASFKERRKPLYRGE